MLLNPAESWNTKGIGVLDLFILFLFYSVILPEMSVLTKKKKPLFA
jgi:hypothetical protein